MSNKFLFFSCVVIIQIFSPPLLFAKSITFTAPKTTLNGEEEMQIIASASGFVSGENIYLKGAFYKDGSSNYFGFTRNGDGWIKNSTKTTDQRRVTVDNWDGYLVVKPDYLDTGFIESGAYKFKLGYYTITGNGDPSSVNWSDTVTEITLQKPLPTSTPVPTATTAPTNTQTPTNIPTQVPTKIVISATLKSTKTPSLSVSPTGEETTVLGVTAESPSPTAIEPIRASAKPKTQVLSNNVVIPLLFVGVGTGILSLVTLGGTILKRFKHKQEY